MCWFAGAPLDNRAVTLVCWLGCSWKPGKATRLFIESAFTAIYCTGGQCGRYNKEVLFPSQWVFPWHMVKCRVTALQGHESQPSGHGLDLDHLTLCAVSKPLGSFGMGLKSSFLHVAMIGVILRSIPSEYHPNHSHMGRGGFKMHPVSPSVAS